MAFPLLASYFFLCGTLISPGPITPVIANCQKINSQPGALQWCPWGNPHNLAQALSWRRDPLGPRLITWSPFWYCAVEGNRLRLGIRVAQRVGWKIRGWWAYPPGGVREQVPPFPPRLELPGRYPGVALPLVCPWELLHPVTGTLY
ncbi:hypothetical protein CEXT_518381 [Caerostris extrusa]|uniref:Uncharacterized protein n=1 Tax=Caerostris extrusa TaxID=172846 RepID=A0AAV4MFA7_CAEEX|nr:hypothetical protein CEXT_518381 [Caerostris extrusa]